MGPPGITPTGLVVPYISKAGIDDRVGQCPEGWVPFDEAKGRFIIGAGVPDQSDLRVWKRAVSNELVPLSAYKPFDSGGEEKHILSYDEMPRHRHLTAVAAAPDQVQLEVSADVHKAIGGTTTPTMSAAFTSYEGSSKDFPIMPPYISLYYCKKT